MEAGKDAEGQVGHTLEAVARSLEFILRRQGITEELEDYKPWVLPRIKDSQAELNIQFGRSVSEAWL